MKRLKQVVLILLFLAAGVAALLYLNAFTQSGENFRYLDWASARVVSADGGETFFDPLAEPPALEKGQFYRFTATLPEHGEEYLVFEVTGLSLALSLDGREIYSSASAPPGGTSSLGQILLPIPAGAGELLVMDCQVLDLTSVLFPPLVRLSISCTSSPSYNASIILYSVPAPSRTFRYPSVKVTCPNCSCAKASRFPKNKCSTQPVRNRKHSAPTSHFLRPHIKSIPPFLFPA